MNAYIYAGGEICSSGVHATPEEQDLTIAADAGWHNAKALGVTPQILVGDLDSLGSCTPPETTEVVRVPVEKDDTDTQLAVRLALSRGAKQITLIAGLSGRIDHTLSTLALLEELHLRKIPAVLTDGQSRVRYLQNGSLLVPKDRQFPYLSLIVVTPKAKGVTLEGCKYPLQNATLLRHMQYAVSNEIVGNAALVSVRRGGVYLIESTDAR